MGPEALIRVTDDGSLQTIGFSADALNDIALSRQIAGEVDQFLQTLDDQRLDSLHVDFSNIDRIGSDGLNGLIGINSQARARGVRLVLLDVQEQVRDVFAVTRLERLFDFSSDAVVA